MPTDSAHPDEGTRPSLSAASGAPHNDRSIAPYVSSFPMLGLKTTGSLTFFEDKGFAEGAVIELAGYGAQSGKYRVTRVTPPAEDDPHRTWTYEVESI